MSSSFHILHEEFIVACVPSGYFTVCDLYGLLPISLNETEKDMEEQLAKYKVTAI